MRSAVLLAGLVTAVVLASAPVAFAHAARISTDPVEGTKLTSGPSQVSATFNEPLQTAFAAMTVVGPDSHVWSAGDPRVDGAVISVRLRPLGPAGRYTVNYRVTSADGHPVTGSWWFELTTAGTDSPGPPVAPASTGGMPVWPFAASGAVLIAIAAVFALRRLKRR